MVIIEGPDGGGKSSLAQHLSKTLAMPLSAHSKLSKKERNADSYRSPEAVRDRVYQAVLQEAGGWAPPEVHDRLLFSELVYSEVYGREPTFPFYESRHLCRLLVACETPVIFCMPPFKELRKHLVTSDEMEGVLENTAKIYNHYVALIKGMSRKPIKGVRNRWGVPFDYNMPRAYLYNYTKPNDLEKIVKVVSDHKIRRAKRASGMEQA